jgi:transketolase
MADKRVSTSEIFSGPQKKARSMENEQLTARCIDTIRILSADMVEKAKSGHPGAPMGCAPITHVLFSEYMRFNPTNPMWYNRDRFVLSNGHACALLYSMLHLTGYNLSLNDLKQFRQLHSKTPGHPENFVTDGVEVSTGPLGQGISNSVGLAMAEKHLAALFNRDGFPIVDHYTFVLCGDGCLQEGVSSEASSLAGHLGLGKLIVCYDDNKITIDGDTSLSFTEDVVKRYESYNWHVQVVEDVGDLAALRVAIDVAKSVTDRPSLIKVRTVIGYGCPKAGSESVHGAPLGSADLAQTKKHFGFNPDESFFIPNEVKEFYSHVKTNGVMEEMSWSEMFQTYTQRFPDLAIEFERRMTGALPVNWKDKLPVYSHTEAKSVATRNRSEEVLNAVALPLPEIFGGSADLTGSNLTNIKVSLKLDHEDLILIAYPSYRMLAISKGILPLVDMSDLVFVNMPWQLFVMVCLLMADSGHLVPHF